MTHAELVARILKYRGPQEEPSCIGNDLIDGIKPLRKNIFTFHEFLTEFNNMHFEHISYGNEKRKYSILVIVCLYKTYIHHFSDTLLSNLLQLLCGEISKTMDDAFENFTNDRLFDHPLTRLISVCRELGLIDLYTPYDPEHDMSKEERNLLQTWINKGKTDNIIPLLVTHEELAKAVKDRLSSMIRKG